MTRTETTTPPHAPGKVCSFLGVVDDAETYSLAFEVDNYCYNRRPKRSVEMEHQVRFCLAGTHTQCPFFAPDATQAPAHAQHAPQPAAHTPQPVANPAATVALPVATTAAATAASKPALKPERQMPLRADTKPARPKAVQAKQKPPRQPAPKPKRQPQPHPVLELQPDWKVRLAWAGSLVGMLAVMALIVYFSFWARMDAQAAGSVSPVQANYLPPGQLGQVLVHVSGHAEDWTAVAARYSTSVEVLQVVNMQPDQPELTPGRLLVVLPGVYDPAGLEPLLVYWNPEPKRVSDAARDFDVAEDHIRYWNQIQGEWIEGQRWLVVGP